MKYVNRNLDYGNPFIFSSLKGQNVEKSVGLLQGKFSFI